MKPVRVIWNDSAGITGWHKKKHMRRHGPKWITSVGFLVRDNRRTVVICQSDNRSGFLADGLAIPRRMVKSVKVLR